MFHNEDRKPEPEILQALVDVADASARLNFHQFSEIALYHPQYGYYTRARQRVGRSRQSDFYTASSLGPVFAELVANAARNLLPAGCNTQSVPWIEVATEPVGSPFPNIDTGFACYRACPLGSPLKLTGPAVVFANEWLDACPFHRFQYHRGRWHECGVELRGGGVEPCLLDTPAAASRPLMDALEADGPFAEGYCLDLSLEAEAQLQSLAAQPWQGLLLLADYGKSWDELTTACPAGTARAYFKHQSTRDLTARPGLQDLTCHVCWDRLERVLRDHHFEIIEISTQERFFMRHATETIGRIIQDRPESFDPRRQTLAEILHPAHMGHAFQILAARRS